MFNITQLIDSEGCIGTQGVGFSPASYVKQTNQAMLLEMKVWPFLPVVSLDVWPLRRGLRSTGSGDPQRPRGTPSQG